MNRQERHSTLIFTSEKKQNSSHYTNEIEGSRNFYGNLLFMSVMHVQHELLDKILSLKILHIRIT